MTEKAPPPLEWHPYYAKHTWLLDWLNREGQYAHTDLIRLPGPLPRIRFTTSAELDPAMPEMRVLTLTRRKAWGPAPYVGRPFHYEWWVGTDDHGRHVASDSRIVYRDWPLGEA